MTDVEVSDFIDSNVVLYLLSADTAKADRAQALLRSKPIISVQVLNEVTSVCIRKLRMDWRETNEFLELVKSFCRVVPVTVEVHDHARALAERHQLSFYDACIASAALLAGCQTLYIEDMHHGLVLEESLTLSNPFR